MKSYLDLVPISAREHRKQNRMSVFCIALAVFLVTVIFGMADMFIRSQIVHAEQEYGKWHLMLRGIDDEQAERVAARPDVKLVSCYGVLNYRGEDGYFIDGKSTVICGSDEPFLTEMQEDMVKEGYFPKTENEALVTANAQKELGLSIGDSVSVQTPDGTSFTFAVTGFTQNAAKLMSEDFYGVFLNTRGYRAVYPAPEESRPAEYNSVFYVQLSNTRNVQKSMDGIVGQLGLEQGQISGNTKLLSLLGQGVDSFSAQIYGAAAILFVLVLLAGIMMIASSLNSNVAGRTQFFGMMRCIGATRKQIIGIVHREALNWCVSAIPLGTGMGIIVICGLSNALRLLAPDYFGAMPVFALSLPSIFAGIMIGLLTVLLAARAPARRAAKVSPLTAATGGGDTAQSAGKAANAGLLRIELALGVRHAGGSKKNYLLMSASFALSIILFLSFSVTIAFMGHALRPLRPWTPDLSVSSRSGEAMIPTSVLDALAGNPAVEKAYGRMALSDRRALFGGEELLVHLISYEENQFGWAEKYLLKGSVDEVREQRGTGMVIYEKGNPLSVGSTITLDTVGHDTLKISGELSDSPFRAKEGIIIICSEQTLKQMSPESGYAVIDIKLKDSATDAQVDEIRGIAGGGFTFSDERLSNSSVTGTYYSFALFIYGFLVLIALVTVFNIINSIAMSVASRTKQYGVFRAIGLSAKQLLGMVVSEAVTYALTGTVFGTATGIALNRLLFAKLISSNWGDAWSFPLGELAMILSVIVFSVFISVQGPVKRVCGMSIVDTISAQ